MAGRDGRDPDVTGRDWVQDSGWPPVRASARSEVPAAESRGAERHPHGGGGGGRLPQRPQPTQPGGDGAGAPPPPLLPHLPPTHPPGADHGRPGQLGGGGAKQKPCGAVLGDCWFCPGVQSPWHSPRCDPRCDPQMGPSPMPKMTYKRALFDPAMQGNGPFLGPSIFPVRTPAP